MRRRRWALLIGVPVLLLGVALFIRSRLPRPTTATDAWLWGLGEETTSLVINHELPILFDSQGKVTKGSGWMQIKDKKGIREVLRSFKNAGEMTSAPDSENLWTEARRLYHGDATYWVFSLYHHDGTYQFLALIESKQGSALSFGVPHREALLPNEAMRGFQQAIARAVTRAKHGEPGYEGRYGWAADGK